MIITFLKTQQFQLSICLYFSLGHEQCGGEEAGVRAALRPLRVQRRGVQQGPPSPRPLRGKSCK